MTDTSAIVDVAFRLPGGRLPVDHAHALLEAIAGALPEVSYESEDPAITEPLSRRDPSLILRDVETLDGEGRIVCRKQGRNVFGQCAFPSTPAGAGEGPE